MNGTDHIVSVLVIAIGVLLGSVGAALVLTKIK